MKTFERLKARLKSDLNLDCTDFKRTYAGSNMKSCGAPVWTAKVRGSTLEVCSGYSASFLLKSKKIVKEKGWSFGEIEINPK